MVPYTHRVAGWRIEQPRCFFFGRSKGESRQHEDLGLCYPNRRSIIWGIYREYVFFLKLLKQIQEDGGWSSGQQWP